MRKLGLCTIGMCAMLMIASCSRQPDLAEQPAAPNCARDFGAANGLAQARRSIAAGDARLLWMIQPRDDEGMVSVLPGVSTCAFPDGTRALKPLAGKVDLTDWRCSAHVYDFGIAYNSAIERAKPGSVAKSCGPTARIDTPLSSK